MSYILHFLSQSLYIFTFTHPKIPSWPLSFILEKISILGRRRTGSELSARPDVWGLASTWDRAGLAVIKLFDLSVHVYMLGLLSYTIFLNALVLLSEVRLKYNYRTHAGFFCFGQCGCLYSDHFRAKYVWKTFQMVFAHIFIFFSCSKSSISYNTGGKHKEKYVMPEPLK